jgi:hypothetical protein
MNSDLRNLIKSFKYFETLLKCSSGAANVTYDNCVAKGEAEKALIEAFLDFSSYKKSPTSRRHHGLPPAFVKAIVHDLKTFKSLDPLYVHQTWYITVYPLIRHFVKSYGQTVGMNQTK